MPDTGIYSEQFVTAAANIEGESVYGAWREWRRLEEAFVSARDERLRLEASIPGWAQRHPRMQRKGLWNEIEKIERKAGIRGLWARIEEISEQQNPLIEQILGDRSGTPVALAAQIDIGFAASENDFLADYPHAAFCAALRSIADQLPPDMREALALALADDQGSAQICDLYRRDTTCVEPSCEQRPTPIDEHDAPINPILRKQAKRWRRAIRRTGTLFRMDQTAR